MLKSNKRINSIEKPINKKQRTNDEIELAKTLLDLHNSVRIIQINITSTELIIRIKLFCIKYGFVINQKKNLLTLSKINTIGVEIFNVINNNGELIITPLTFSNSTTQTINCFLNQFVKTDFNENSLELCSMKVFLINIMGYIKKKFGNIVKYELLLSELLYLVHFYKKTVDGDLTNYILEKDNTILNLFLKKTCSSLLFFESIIKNIKKSTHCNIQTIAWLNFGLIFVRFNNNCDKILLYNILFENTMYIYSINIYEFTIHLNLLKFTEELILDLNKYNITFNKKIIKDNGTFLLDILTSNYSLNIFYPNILKIII